MKVYKLTIGIDEVSEEVEFISEELFNVDESFSVAELTEEESEEESFLSFVKQLFLSKFTIIGKA
jgi:hypothetical protein